MIDRYYFKILILSQLTKAKGKGRKTWVNPILLLLFYCFVGDVHVNCMFVCMLSAFFSLSFSNCEVLLFYFVYLIMNIYYHLLFLVIWSWSLTLIIKNSLSLNVSLMWGVTSNYVYFKTVKYCESKVKLRSVRS